MGCGRSKYAETTSRMSNHKHDYDRPAQFQWYSHDPALSGRGEISPADLQRPVETPGIITWGKFFRDKFSKLGETLKENPE